VGLIKEFGLKPRFAEAPKNKVASDNEKLVDETDHFKATVTVKKTVRSGQRISFEGNLVIMGDVNPGAEVIASGDIVVLGRLRGTAHAGAEGDETSQVIAFQLRPVQIRIAGVITRDSEPGPKVKYLGPEVARIKDGMIVVERVSY
jgi:septum site-determining protein MinC